jgi:hypothetical protein
MKLVGAKIGYFEFIKLMALKKIKSFVMKGNCRGFECILEHVLKLHGQPPIWVYFLSPDTFEV